MSVLIARFELIRALKYTGYIVDDSVVTLPTGETMTLGRVTEANDNELFVEFSIEGNDNTAYIYDDWTVTTDSEISDTYLEVLEEVAQVIF